MNQIKFDHHYKKLGCPLPKRARLLSERVMDAGDIPQDFKKYDTLYTNGGWTREFHTEMPKGIVLVLWFWGDNGRFFPTIRSLKNQAHYRHLVGSWFDVIIK